MFHAAKKRRPLGGVSFIYALRLCVQIYNDVPRCARRLGRRRLIDRRHNRRCCGLVHHVTGARHAMHLAMARLSRCAFLASSDSENANVECFSSDAETTPIDVPGCELLYSFVQTLHKSNFISSLHRGISGSVSRLGSVLTFQCDSW